MTTHEAEGVKLDPHQAALLGQALHDVLVVAGMIRNCETTGPELLLAAGTFIEARRSPPSGEHVSDPYKLPPSGEGEALDAARFRALMRCGRIKMQGSSGVDPHTRERNGNNVHFGAEFWPEPPKPEYAHLDGGEKSTLWGRACLRALADAILESEGHSAPTRPAPAEIGMGATNLDRVREFHQAFGVPAPPSPKFPDDRIELRLRILDEERQELGDAIVARDLVEVADALTDMAYLIYGTALEFGIDLNACFREVHRSNMSKLGADGKPIYREDGKVLKGPNYSPPDLAALASTVLVEGEKGSSVAGLPAHASPLRSAAATDTPSDLEQEIAEALQDSLGPDWTCADGARAVMAALLEVRR